ncbi:hypothetical protein [Cellulomonas sp.]|uniref:hypothetical protein n=1 Tax=Cellulomonas sp. TaxID=40001 RepID=UPI001B217DBE|nr:hypothetical protein [Cellulomonas sp.]MBO9553940.1 hypothetical protein [Cellulomonas sp.]
MSARGLIRWSAVVAAAAAMVLLLPAASQGASDVLCARAAELVRAADPGAALTLLDEREQELDALARRDTGTLCPAETRAARRNQAEADKLVKAAEASPRPANAPELLAAAKKLDAKDPDVVRLTTDTTWAQDRGTQWTAFSKARLEPLGAPAAVALAITFGWLVVGRVLVQAYPASLAFRDGRKASRRVAAGAVAAVVSGLMFTLWAPALQRWPLVAVVAGAAVVGGCGAFALSYGLASRLRITIDATSSDDQDAPSASRILAILRKLGADPPRGLEVPVGTDVSVLSDAVTKVPQASWLSSIVTALSAVLGFTPWKVVLDKTADGTAVVVTRNGRTMDSTIVRADVLGTGMPSATSDVLVASFVLLTLADGYRERVGFEGLLGSRSWKSIGMVASTQPQVAPPATTDKAEVRRMLSAAALLEDNPFTRIALHESLYRDRDDAAVAEGYAQWLYEESTRYGPGPSSTAAARAAAGSARSAVASAVAARTAATAVLAARSALDVVVEAEAAGAATSAQVLTARAALRRAVGERDAASRSDAESVCWADLTDVLARAAAAWAARARSAGSARDAQASVASTMTARAVVAADLAERSRTDAERAARGATAAARAAASVLPQPPADLPWIGDPSRRGLQDSDPPEPGASEATRLRLLNACVAVTLNVLATKPRETVAVRRLDAAWRELRSAIAAARAARPSPQLVMFLDELDAQVVVLAAAVEKHTTGTGAGSSGASWTVEEHNRIGAVALHDLGPRAYNAMCVLVADREIDRALALYGVVSVDKPNREWSLDDPALEPLRRRDEMWEAAVSEGLLSVPPFAASATALKAAGLTSAATVAATAPGVLADLVHVSRAEARRQVDFAAVLTIPERELGSHLVEVAKVLVDVGATDAAALRSNAAAVSARLSAVPGLRAHERARLSDAGRAWLDDLAR